MKELYPSQIVLTTENGFAETLEAFPIELRLSTGVEATFADSEVLALSDLSNAQLSEAYDAFIELDFDDGEFWIKVANALKQEIFSRLPSTILNHELCGAVVIYKQTRVTITGATKASKGCRFRVLDNKTLSEKWTEPWPSFDLIKNK